MNDKDIVQLFFERSQQAINELSQKYGKFCFRIALNILKCNEDAEGMKENVFHEGYGELPKEAEDFSRETEDVAGENAEKAGFAIYVDTSSFELTEEEGCHMIRGKRTIYTREDAGRDVRTLCRCI